MLVALVLAVASPAAADYSPSGFASRPHYDADATGIPPLLDIVLIRPVTLVTGVVATAFWAPLVGLPLAIFGQGDVAIETFKKGPGVAFNATFRDPIGTH